MIKHVFLHTVKVFQAYPKGQLHKLDDWVLILLGSISFLLAGYWGMEVAKFLPRLIDLTNQYGLPPKGAAIFVFLGCVGASIWFFGCLARRCGELLYQRHFR